MNNFFEKYTNEFVEVLNALDKEKLTILYKLIQQTKKIKIKYLC